MKKFLNIVLRALLVLFLFAGLVLGLRSITYNSEPPYEIWSGVSSNFSDGTMIIVEKGSKTKVIVLKTAVYNGLPIENNELPREGVQYKLYTVYDDSFFKKPIGYRLEWNGYSS